MPQPSAIERSKRAFAAGSPELEPARMIPGWQCERLIGEGQLTCVFAARPQGNSTSTHSPYVLKLLRAPWDGDCRAIKMLRREAWVGQNIAHTHLVPVLAAGLAEPPFYLVMPQLRGTTLGTLAMADEPLRLPVALWIARQVAEALGALDDAGWLHGDVKPANIFVSPEMHVTLIDLGFASREGEAAQLGERPILGTARYMAPEMFSATSPVDIRSDLYSLGIVLFELLAGRPPFAGEDPLQLAIQHREALPGRLRNKVPTVPTRVARLVQAMLAKSPMRRPQRPQEVANQLASLEIETFGDRFDC
jgi:eukaryotic-like serine/threonine-protein kinase